MKTLNVNEMQEVTAEGTGQDFVSGILCGVAIGMAVGSGGLAIGLAIVGCGVAFGDW